MQLTSNYTGVIIAVFLYPKGCDEEGPAVDVHREPGMLRSRQQKLPSDYRFRADVPNEV